MHNRLRRTIDALLMPIVVVLFFSAWLLFCCLGRLAEKHSTPSENELALAEIITGNL